MPETVQVKYDGGLATNGQLHFYEFSRSQYALARFITTIEHFRRTGLIAERINSRNYVELVVSAPERGSFILDILIESIKDGTAELVAAPFAAFFGYVWHMLIPRRDRTDQATIELARLKLAVEVERTAQAKEKTGQLAHIRAIADGERASAADAIALFEWARGVPRDIADALETSPGERVDMLRELEAEREREEEFSDDQDELANLDEGALNKLTSRLRPMVGDISLPLKRSATTMTIGSAESEHENLAYITTDIVRLIQTRTPEDELVEIRGHIKSYDRDIGLGKVQSDELPRVLNFIVPVAERRNLRDQILAAMRINVVTLVVRRVVDDGGNPTSLILVDLEFDEE
jgi:hypothetical protein